MDGVYGEALDLRLSSAGQAKLDALQLFIAEVMRFEEGAKLYQMQLRELLGNRQELFHDSGPWPCPPIMEQWKEEAKKRGLWNLFLPDHPQGGGLSHLDYAYLAEKMGAFPLTSEACNCSAPDTGNMEVLVKYGNHRQQQKWLQPLLSGTIRSCYLMTEPEVASSDARNIRISIVREGDFYVINGRKWWTSGAMDARCKVGILMGKIQGTSGQSMLVLPMDLPGITIVRSLRVFGYDDAPHGHAEVCFLNVRVRCDDAILLGEGRGAEIAQGRLGGGRVHHCMRAIGVGERALSAMAKRSVERQVFGRSIAKHGMFQRDLVQSRIDIDQSRLLVLRTARLLDLRSPLAKQAIAMIKVQIPKTMCNVLDRAIQVHGGMGVSQDSFLAYAYAQMRTLRLADGPDEVHTLSCAMLELKRLGLAPRRGVQEPPTFFVGSNPFFQVRSVMPPASTVTGHKVEFFFDVISPYTYLAWKILPRVRNLWNLDIQLKPLFLGGVMKEAGNSPPALVPARGRHMMRDLRRTAEIYGIRPPRTPANFFSQVARDVLRIQRLLATALVETSLLSQSQVWGLVDQAFYEVWENTANRDSANNMCSSDDAFLKRMCSQAGVDTSTADMLIAKMASTGKQAVLNNTKSAVTRGAYGAPTFFLLPSPPHVLPLREEMVFGADRWDHIAHLIGESCPSVAKL